MTSAARLSLLAAGTATLVALAGCSATQSTGDADLVNGKKLFVQKCGSCHVMNRAATKGTVGPNLDTAFANALAEGFGESAIRGMVDEQIDLVRRGSKMPADIVTGDDRHDVSAYVARSVGRSGKDEGLLASAVKSQASGEAAKAENGVLTIPADPNGQLAFVYTKAEAPAGQLTIKMPNESGVPHNIAIDGKGSSEIIENGESEFKAMFEAGEYEYVCEVEGHLAAGMKGTLTVK